MAGTETSNAGPWRGVLGSNTFPAEPNRYHLYVGLFCPFAHRVLLAWQMKGLQDILLMSIVRPYPKGEEGWRFPKDDSEYPGSTVDHLFHSAFLREVYFKSPPSYGEYSGRYSVPVLWDKQTNQIVNNESEDIMRQLNSAFNDLLPEGPTRSLNLYPEELKDDIDSINTWLPRDLNAGVYMAGFAPTQEGYEKGCRNLFATLDKLEALLKSHDAPYILNQHLTELDLKAYATLVRFDTIYVQHFKLNIGTIRHNFPCLHRYLKNLYWNVPGFKETTNFIHIKEGYSKCHGDINPKGITPIGPVPDVEFWTAEDEAWKQKRSS